MADLSELTLITRLNTHLNGLLMALDTDIIGKETAKAISAIKRTSADARLDIRDYEMADSRTEMQRHARTAVKRLEELRRHILKASESGIFGAVDVAVLSAEVDEIAARLG
ncbi:MAG TPA: hypothetical protein VF572_05290 [Candidatus Saccharimonadales bacterium]